MLHDAPDSVAEREPREDWTPWRGFLRALLWGGLACAVLMVLLDALAWVAPLVVLNVWLRAAMGFLVALPLFAVVHRAAGMAGAACTGLVLAFCILLFFSQHIVFALHGVLMVRAAHISGAAWLDPATLLLVNLPALIGIGFCVAFCHGGGAVLRSLAEILMSRVG